MSFVNVATVALVQAAAGADPDVLLDWTEVFRKAIATAVTNGDAGVFVPARKAPYLFKDPHGLVPPSNMSIDLRGKHGFVLAGEGPRSVLAMSGPGSWRLIHIGNGATDIVLRDLCLDGSATTNADQQSHLVVIGASIKATSGARRITVLDCILRNAPSDGIAIVPNSSTDRSDEVSDIKISQCHFLDNGRSGISNQRLGKRVSILHNRFLGTSDQDIDFEPSGDLPDSGPSGYLILGNTMVRSSLSTSVTLSGTTPESPSKVNTFAYNQILGGQLGVIDAHDLSIVGNHIETGPKVLGTVVRMSGSIERVLFADNSVVRPSNAPPGTLMNVSSSPTDYAFPSPDASVQTGVNVATDTFTHEGHRLQTGVGPLVTSVDPAGGALPGGLDEDQDYWAIRLDKDTFKLAASPTDAVGLVAVNLTSTGSASFHLVRHGFPRTVNASRNRFSTFRLSGGEPLITFDNASGVGFTDNDVASYAGTTTAIKVALKLGTNDDVHKRQVSGWDVAGNRFSGDAKLSSKPDQSGIGAFTIGVSLAVGHDTVRNVRVADNAFSGCTRQVMLEAAPEIQATPTTSAIPAGSFAPAAHVTGSLGDGEPLVLSGVAAVLVSGNLSGTTPAGARFCGKGDPQFTAPAGSLYSRTGGGPLPRLWINLDGGILWKPLVVAP